MTGNQTFLARAALSATAAGASLLLIALRHRFPASNRLFDRTVLTLFAVSRLGLFSLLFFLLHLAARGDVPAYYVPEANHALAHQLVYRDYESSYAPLHSYFDGALLHLWHSPLAIILFTVLFEIATLPLWFRVARTFLPENKARIGALLYLASPASLQFVTVDGQNNVLIAGLIALSLLLVVKHREIVSGALVGLAIAVIKFLPLIFVPAYILCTPRRWRWTLGLSAVVLPVYGGFLLRGSPIQMPLTAQGGMKSSGDLPYLVESLFGISLPGPLTDLLLLAVLATIIALVARALPSAVGSLRIQLLNWGIVALMLALIVFSKKSNSSYLMLALYPLCLLIDAGTAHLHRLSIALFAAFQFIDVMEHSIWSSFLGQYTSDVCHQALLQRHPLTVLFLLVQTVLQAGLLWLLVKAVRQILLLSRSSDPARNAQLVV